MSALPRILVIDDVLGQRWKGRNRIREDFCVALDLDDITGDVQAEEPSAPVAKVVFCSGQVQRSGVLENDIESILQVVRKGWDQWPRWALLLLDLRFKTGRVRVNGEPEGRVEDRDPSQFFGLTVLERLWKDQSLQDIPVVVLSAMKEHRDAIEHRFASHGAWDFIDKSELEQKPQKLKELLDRYGLVEDSRIIGHSIPLLKALREARARARHGNDNILILGESGTGKELLADYIHKQSRRRGEYVALFTEGVPETLIDDRLCGHERGAFTGAKQAIPGAAEVANGGTLFIDEFGNIPASIQQKLLRLLDKNTREIQRLGSNDVRKLDLQVVMATNRLDILSSGDFRRDLLFRAKVHDAIVLPPLRQRAEDIPLLAERFVRKYENEFAALPRTVSVEAMEKLKAHPWPDNVRGLERVIERAVYTWSGLKILAANHLNLDDSLARMTKEKSKVGAASAGSTSPGRRTVANADGQREAGITPQELVRILSSVSFDGASSSNLAGELPAIQRAYARMIASYLEAALLATRRPTPENPEGDILIHPAVKLITGDPKITASKAADIVKRLLTLDMETGQKLGEQPVLKKAYEIALRLRPRTKGSAKR